ncbi:MAG: hypothetical protein ACO1O6_06905 [Bacteroidota bacterium]
MAQQELRNQYEDKANKQDFKKALHIIGKIAVFGFAIIAGIVISIRLSHLCLPGKWQWLDKGQIENIDHLFFSGAIGGFIANYYKKMGDH